MRKVLIYFLVLTELQTFAIGGGYNKQQVLSLKCIILCAVSHCPTQTLVYVHLMDFEEQIMEFGPNLRYNRWSPEAGLGIFAKLNIDSTRIYFRKELLRTGQRPALLTRLGP